MRDKICILKKIPALAVVLILLIQTAHAEISGSIWGKLNEDQRNMIVAGLLSGANLGSSLTALGCYSEQVENTGDSATCSFVAQNAYNKAWKKYIDGTDVAQLSSGLNEFYSDFKNMKINLSEASFIVLRQIKQEDMREYIENARIRNN